MAKAPKKNPEHSGSESPDKLRQFCSRLRQRANEGQHHLVIGMLAGFLEANAELGDRGLTLTPEDCGDLAAAIDPDSQIS